MCRRRPACRAVPMLASWAAAGGAAAGGPVVQLSGGAAEGTESGGVGAWRGVPYAAPPVGDLRWRPPRPAAAWRPATYDATRARSDCVQELPEQGGAEDCLYVNVYAPVPAPRAPAAVMLWIYGGGFNFGGTDNLVYDGAADVALRNGSLVVVTFNYRLNVFGFAASDLLRARDPAGGTGNYGILDQRLAMGWVRENIHAFGGDRDRVFIVGQSAGGDSVSQHLVRRGSWGLFASAGVESGAFYTLQGPGVPKPLGPSPGNVTVADQEGRFAALLKKTGCGDVDCLIQLPAAAILPGEYDWGWEPTIDGVDLTAPAAVLASRGELAPVPVIVGSTMEDAGNSHMACAPALCSEADFRRWATDTFGYNKTEADRMTSLYADETARPGGTGYTKWYWAGAHASADLEHTCTARRLARWVARAGQSAWWYYWTYVPKGPNGAYPSLAHHGVELPFVFHHSVDASEVGLADAVVGYWASFAAGGRPDGATEWAAYDDAARAALVFGDNMSVAMSPGLRGGKCDFWDRHWGDSWKA